MKKEYIIIIFLITIIVLLIIGFSIGIRKERIYKVILKANVDISEISLDGQQAKFYYQEASYAYEDEDFKEVERNCRLARNYYFEESQGYREIKVKLKNEKVNDQLINLYLENLDLLSEIKNNMFEACEYFESAARYFDIYYNTNVSYEDRSYDMGVMEIEMMNEKILSHDNAVERYNNKLSEFKIELENRLN